MSTQVKVKFRETLKSAKDLLKALKDATNEQLARTAPQVANQLDAVLDEASKVFSDALETIDSRTSREQLELLKAYRSFLSKQTELIDGRMEALKKAQPPSGDRRQEAEQSRPSSREKCSTEFPGRIPLKVEQVGGTIAV